MKKLSIVIPAYNEGKRIRDTLENLTNNFKDAEIIVVSNGSRDDTVSILKEWKDKNKNVNYLDFDKKLGKGGALIEGLKIAKGDLLGFTDADDAFDLKYIELLLKELENNDCVIASKWKGRGIMQVTEPFTRKVLSRGWNFLVNRSLGLNFTDTQAGAKFFKKEVFEGIDQNFVCHDFSFDAELLYKIKKGGFSTGEYFVPSKHQEGSTFSNKHAFAMFKSLVKLWMNR